MPEIYNPPDSDFSSSGTWTIEPADGIFYNKVLTNDGDTTYIMAVSDDCQVMFLHPNAGVPANAVSILIRMFLKCRLVSSGTGTIRQVLRIGGANYLDPSGSGNITWTTYTPDVWTRVYNYAFVDGRHCSVNPVTGLPFTPDEVNGIGTYGIQAMGFICPDAAPDIRFTKYDFFVYYGIPPTVTTQAVTDKVPPTATGNGTIVAIGSAPVTQHGCCWSLSIMPNIADNKTENGEAEAGPFTSEITGLVSALYHVRAYATNSFGTGYGADVQFSCMKMGNIAIVGKRLHYIGYDGVERYILGTPL